MNIYYATKRLKYLSSSKNMYDSARWELVELCHNLTLAGYTVVIDKENKTMEIVEEQKGDE